MRWMLRCATVMVLVSVSGAIAPGQTTQPASGKTGLVTDDRYLLHLTGAGHPERPERASSIVAGLKKAGLFDRCVILPPRPAAQPPHTA